MFAYLNFLILSMQVNKFFLTSDVLNIIEPRLPKSKRARFLFGDLDCKGVVVPTNPLKHSIVSMKSSKLHIFAHDNVTIQSCLWDGNVMFDDKKEIIENLYVWLMCNEYYLNHYIYDYEDGLLFTEIFGKESKK